VTSTVPAVIPAPSVWKVGTVASVHVPGWGGNLAGQHLDLRLSAPDGYQAVRSYSIASASMGDRLELAVDRLPDGEVSPYLVDDLQVGDELEIRGPLGGWFVWRPTQTEPVQLIGGGSGIVPLMAMARAHAASGSSARFKLLYSVRSPHDVFFAEELMALASPNFEITWVYTRETPADWPSPAGRLSPAVLEASTIAANEMPTVFVCGPTGFVESVADWLVALGHPAASVKTERFGGK
jgi:ferredoxin-NADP reductase